MFAVLYLCKLLRFSSIGGNNRACSGRQLGRVFEGGLVACGQLLQAIKYKGSLDNKALKGEVRDGVGDYNQSNVTF